MIVMRLLSSLKHDESERGIYQLGRKVIKNGGQSIIIASADMNDDLVKRLIREGNQYHQLEMKKKSWLSLLKIRALRKLIEWYQPDIIHMHSRTPAWVLYWALRKAKLNKNPKLVSTMYGFYPINRYARALLMSDVIITVSDSVTQYLMAGLSEHQLADKSIVRIYRGVDTRMYPYRYNPSVYWLRRTFAEFPELEHKKWLLFPTLIGKQYGQEWLIDILGNLAETYPNLHIIIMDDDKDNGDIVYEEFRQRAYALELQDHISFVGSRRNDMREWLAAANVVVALANEPESIGITILQALHLGTPVVGWDKAAYSEILRPLYPQGLVKQQNATTLIKIIKNQLDIVSRPPMPQEFELTQTIDDTFAVYQHLIESKPIPPFFSQPTQKAKNRA